MLIHGRSRGQGEQTGTTIIATATSPIAPRLATLAWGHFPQRGKRGILADRYIMRYRRLGPVRNPSRGACDPDKIDGRMSC